MSKYEAGERRLDVVELLQVLKALDEKPEHIVRDLANEVVRLESA